MALTARAMASAAQAHLRPVEPSHANSLCRSRTISPGAGRGGVFCKPVLDGVWRKHLQWNANANYVNADFLARSFCKLRQRRRRIIRSSAVASANHDARVSGGVRQGSAGTEEIDLRFMFLEAIMERARKADVDGVEEAMTGMSLAGLEAGPRAYHGFVVAYTRAGDAEGAVRFI